MYINFSHQKGIVCLCSDYALTCVAIMVWQKPFPLATLGERRQENVP